MGKLRSPNKAEKEWLKLVAKQPCIACSNVRQEQISRTQVHHVVGRSRKNGHWLLLPLCGEHHERFIKTTPFSASVHSDKREFHRRYGRQEELFKQLCDEINNGKYPWE